MFSDAVLFTDAGELVFSKAASTATTASGSFTVPSTVALGSTRMRVSMKYNGVPTSCETLTYGQVEDYTVNITLTAAGISAIASVNETASENKFDYTIYPNPVENVLKISASTGDFEGSFTIINMIGQQVKSGKVTQDGIDVNEMKSGVYFVQVTDGQNTITKKFVKN